MRIQLFDVMKSSIGFTRFVFGLLGAVLLLPFGYFAVWTVMIVAATSFGYERSLGSLMQTFDQHRVELEKLVTLCGDQPALYSVNIESQSINTYLGISDDTVAQHGEAAMKHIARIDAYNSYCSWNLNAKPPTLYSVAIGFYSADNSRGTYKQDIVYYAPENIPDPNKLSYPEERVTLTPLPAEGWYIWEQGINHEDAAP